MAGGNGKEREKDETKEAKREAGFYARRGILTKSGAKAAGTKIEADDVKGGKDRLLQLAKKDILEQVK